jgi:hypothetical protein
MWQNKYFLGNKIMKIKYALILLLVGCFAFPSYAGAYGCDCGSVQSIVTSNGQLMAQLTIESVNQVTIAEAEQIRSEILRVGMSLESKLNSLLSSLTSELANVAGALGDQMKAQSGTEQASKTVDMYGEEAMPGALCGSTGLAGGVQVGAQAQAQVAGALTEDTVLHVDKFDVPREYEARIYAEDHPDLQKSTAAIFPLENTLTVEQVADAAKVVNTVMNPSPSPKVSDRMLESDEGIAYSVQRLVNQSRTTLASEPLNKHIAYYSPTLSGDVVTWAKEQWSKSGGQGDEPGIVNGKMSEAALHSLLSKIRIASPNWHMELATATDSGLLRELNLMMSVIVDMLRKNNELLDGISVMLALQTGTVLEATSKKDEKDLYLHVEKAFQQQRTQ